MIVYLDEIFVVNLVMDWLILWAVGNLAQCHTPAWRLWLAALLGAGYSVMILLVPARWLSIMPVRIGWSLLMLQTAYKGGWRSHVKLASYFYLVSFAFGGASLGAMYLFSQPILPTWSGVALVELDFQLFWLIIGAGITVTAVYELRGRLRQDIASTKTIVTARVQFQEKTITLRLLADTGHSLNDPLTGKSVLVAEHRKMLPLFSDAVQKQLATTADISPNLLLELTQEPDMAGRWNIIPYQVIGRQGIMLGFRPDYVYLKNGKSEHVLRNITIALAVHQFSVEETYQGLVSLDLL